MATCADILASARLTLNDETTSGGEAVEPRHGDPELLKYLNDGLANAYARRPELRFASMGTPFTALALSDAFPLPIQHEAALAYYITYRAEAKDDEHVSSGRAAGMLSLFERGILTT